MIRSPFYRRGFTLLEIITVLAVLSILVAVAIPFYRDYTTRATVTDALAVADEGRLPVEMAKAEGREKNIDKDLQVMNARSPRNAAGAISLLWDTRNQAIIARANIPGIGNDKPALALQRGAEGSWVCLNAARLGQSDALEERFLPASCHGAGTTLAGIAGVTSTAGAAPTGGVPAPAACPADQESISLPTGPACTPKCPTGKTRDSSNPTQCRDVVCGPNERKNGNGVCVVVGPQPDCGTTGDPHIAYSSDNTPQWSCFPKCESGKIRDSNNWFSCIADPNAKPVATATPVAKPAVAATAPATRPGEDKKASVKCRSCDPAAPELCEIIHQEITCEAPNNWCITFVDNHDDGAKTVNRGCGDFERVYREWFQGTSDDDKCRDRINVEQHLDFTCTFGCGTDNCNDNLRPAEDSLYQAK